MFPRKVISWLILTCALGGIIWMTWWTVAGPPTTAEGYYARANAYSKEGRLDRAVADYTEAIRLDPRYFDAYEGRGWAYDHAGEFDKAIADFTTALKILPNSPPQSFR